MECGRNALSEIKFENIPENNKNPWNNGGYNI